MKPVRLSVRRITGNPERPGGSTGTVIDKKCDQLFPPNKPQFAIRNVACHQMYGSG
ncbi:hypothetical protein [Nonomuraea guangzhouensis]|uniref:Uncharacterized protein n=1 Tax=Nonomuraea guangzhouensis TaxID=1291555 RepID=A0ABW4G868_9ACTN|nr:hypothetical protein [Nonomuraea guangzhouensis]